MKKRTILLLQKIDKINKDKVISDYANAITEFNDVYSRLKLHQISMQNELLYENGITNESPEIRYATNWKPSLQKKILEEQIKMISSSSNMETSRINLKKSIKNSSFHANFS